MDTLNAPQIIEHVSHSVAYTPFDVKWIPCSAKFVVMGQTPRAKGLVQIYQMNQGKLEIVTEVFFKNILKLKKIPFLCLKKSFLCFEK